MVMQKN